MVELWALNDRLNLALTENITHLAVELDALIWLLRNFWHNIIWIITLLVTSSLIAGPNGTI